MDPKLEKANEGEKNSQFISPGLSNLSKNLEAFALDLVRLIRGALYPSKHPSFLGVAERVVAGAPVDSTGSLTIGVTPTELVVSGEFVAGKASRLAGILHARKVLRIFWYPHVSPADVSVFARLLSTPKIEGTELRQKLRFEGVYSIDLEPLELPQIHGVIGDSVEDVQKNQEARRRKAWISLIETETSVERIGSSLVSEQFWMDAKATWADLGYGDSEGFSNLLADLGDRFEKAISLLPKQQRETALNHFSEIGKNLSIPELVRIVARESQGAKDIGQGVASLLRRLDGEQFVDLLAGLAARGDQATHRLVEVYRRLTPGASTDGLLAIVKARLSLGQNGGFAIEVLKTVENLILKLEEKAFMAPEYSNSLDHLVDPLASAHANHERRGLPEASEAPEKCLDHVILALATEPEDFWRLRVLHRIEACVEQLGIFQLLEYVRLVDEAVPTLLDSNPSLLRNLFRKGLSALCRSTTIEGQTLTDFTLAHERVLLDIVLKSLEKEEKISTRYFLVSLLSSFSLAGTPPFVSKARNGPWYVARNLAIVLGKQGFPQALPALRALSNHAHPKVRKEALKALRKIENSLRNSGTETSTEKVDGKCNNQMSEVHSYNLEQ